MQELLLGVSVTFFEDNTENVNRTSLHPVSHGSGSMLS